MWKQAARQKRHVYTETNLRKSRYISYGADGNASHERDGGWRVANVWMKLHNCILFRTRSLGGVAVATGDYSLRETGCSPQDYYQWKLVLNATPFWEVNCMIDSLHTYMYSPLLENRCIFYVRKFSHWKSNEKNRPINSEVDFLLTKGNYKEKRLFVSLFHHAIMKNTL